MGQGNYVSVVYGTVETLSEAAHEAIERGNYRETPSRAYESRQPWVGYMVAANGGMADRPMLDLERFAIPLDGLREHIEKHAAEPLAIARAKWDAWREKHPEFPPGELLFVADYD